jgi:hypothetical protein
VCGRVVLAFLPRPCEQCVSVLVGLPLAWHGQ